MLKQVIFTLLITSTFAGVIERVEVQAAPNTVGSLTSSYDFTLYNLPNQIPTNGILTITFPSTFIVPNDLQIFAFQGISVNSYVTISNNTISIRNGSPYSRSLIFFRISQRSMTGIIPLTNQTGFIQVYTRYSNNSVIDYNTTISISISPTRLQNLTIESYNPLTSARSSLLLRFQVSNLTATSGTLSVKFPISNPQGPQDKQRSILVRPRFCIKKSNVCFFPIFIDFSKNGDQWLPYDIYNDQLIIREAFSAPFNSNSQIVIEISDIINPYSLSPIGFIEVAVISGLGGYVAENKDGQFSVSTPSRPKLVEVISSNKALGQPTNFTVRIQPLSFFNELDTIQLTFPLIMNIGQYSSTLEIHAETSGLNGTINYLVQDNTLVLPSVFRQYTEEEVRFRINGITNVGYFSDNTSFQIYIRDSNNMLIAQQLTDIPYLTIADDLTLVNFDISDRQMRSVATYIFSLELQTTLDEGTLEIIFPDDYQVFAQGVICQVTVNGTALGNCQAENRTIRALSIFPLPNQAKNVEVSVQNVINPILTGERTSNFIIRTMKGGNIIHLLKQTLTVTLIPSFLRAESIRILNDQGYPSGIFLKLATQKLIVPNSIIELEFTNDIRLQPDQLKCSLPPSNSSLACTSNAQKILIINAFQDQGASVGSTIEIITQGLSNLRPTEPGCLFNVTIRAPDGSVTQVVNSSISLRSSPPPSIFSIDLKPLISIPNLETNYIMKFQAPFDLQVGDQARITFPNSFVENLILNQGPERVLLSPNNRTLVFSLVQSYQTFEPVEIVLEKIKNPSIFTQDIFDLQLMSKEGNLLAQQSFEPQEPQGTISSLESFKASLVSARVGEITSLQLNFVNKERISQDDLLQVEVPKSLKVLSPDCSTTFGGQCELSNNNIISITNLSEPLLSGNHTVTLPDVQNKQDNTLTSDVFVLSVISSVNQTKLFASYLLPQEATCIQGCRYCKNFYNECWECESGWFFLNGTCASQCPETYFYQQGECLLCELDNCLVCESATVCQTCEPGYFFLSGRCQRELSASNFIIVYLFFLAILLTCTIRTISPRSGMLTVLVPLMSILLFGILVWASVELGVLDDTFLLVLFISFLVIILLQHVFTIKLMYWISSQSNKNGVFLPKSTNNQTYIFLMKWFGFKFSLPVYANGPHTFLPFDPAEAEIISYLRLILMFDVYLMLIITATALFSGIKMLDSSIHEFVFFIQIAIYTAILGALEVYLAVRIKNPIENYHHVSQYLESEGNESTLRKFRQLTHSSKEKDKSHLEYSISPESLRLKLNNQPEITVAELSFRDHNFGKEPEKKVAQTPKEKKVFKPSAFYFSEGAKKTVVEGGILQNISFFSEAKATKREDRAITSD